MAFNFNSWINRFKKYDTVNKVEVDMSTAAITTETTFNSVATGTQIVRDDGITYEKNAKGAWQKAQTKATDSTFGGVKLEWLDATTVNIITK